MAPARGDSSWLEPTAKYLQRCQLWEDKPLGLQWQTLAYNAFAISTLTYVAQLEAPPATTKQAELAGLSLAIKGPNGIGPRGWATPPDLWRMREDYGQQVFCRLLIWLSEATMARVYLSDPACNNSQFQRNLTHLRRTMRIPNNLQA